MKLSVITVNLNNCEGLQKTIDSIVAQTYRDFEWIVVDGGSTDGSIELIERYSQYVSYSICEPDTGIYNGMNKGIRASKGEFLLFLNSGDYLYDKSVLSRAVPLLQEKDFYVGKELKSDGFLWTSNISSPLHLCYTMSTISLPHQSTFINRRVFDRYGEYREDMQCASDWWLFYKALVMGNATAGRLDFIISVFDVHGISGSAISRAEQQRALSEIPNVSLAVWFYCQNCEVVESLKRYKFVWFLVRAYFYLYRKFCNKHDN